MPEKMILRKQLLILAIVSIVLPLLFTKGIYPLLNLPPNAPIPIRIFAMGGLIFYFLKRNKESYHSIGLVKIKSIPIFVLITLLLLTCFLFLPGIVQQVIAMFLTIAPADYSFFENVQGNVGALIFWLLLSWVVGGFLEEVIFRGYLQSRLAQILGGNKASIVIVVILQAIIFGLFHYYQGAAGMISTGFIALIAGVFYAFYKNLWANIIAHGLLDTIGFIVIYSNGTANL
ncbi:MAG: CPBP family intramembrane metalloprotease [bacterium]|nr:CPBP family intramembrane metalloprotease [bacterium]